MIYISLKRHIKKLSLSFFEKPIFIITLLILSFMVSSCSYRWGSADRKIPGGYQLLAVPVFVNKTQEVSIERYFTKYMIMEIEKSKLAKVTSKGESQAILRGEIINLEYVPGAEVTSEVDGLQNLPKGRVLSKDYRVMIDLEVKLVRSSDMALLWSGRFSGERRYSAPMITKPVLNTANPLYNHSARLETVSLIAKDVMGEAFQRMTENF